ncbi:MAG TPA: Tad domain-containing protein [Pyrinomonadaceae bacterium]|nr:Tad domain-containing protein [Pyrinomonadaceae bacterium]
MKSSSVRRGRGGERGSVLAVSAVGMMAFLLATGLAVDISHLYLVRTELQNAADAAALAGASALNGHATGIEKAEVLTRQSLNKYEFNKKTISPAGLTVEYSRNLDTGYVSKTAARGDAANIRFVRVALPPSAVGTTFSSMVLGKAVDLSAKATAGMSVPLNIFCDYLPITAVDAEEGEPERFTPGQTYTIRRPPGGAITPGNYQILAIDGPGGADDRIGLGKGVRNCLAAGSMVKTKPGVTAGDVRQGINTRFGEYAAGLDPAEYPPDRNVKEGIDHDLYLNSQVSPGTSNFQPPPRGLTGEWERREVIIPLVKASEFAGGRDMVKIERFGLFFLQTKVGGGSGGEFKVEFIEFKTVVGRGGYEPGAGPVNPDLSIPVLYK